MSNSSTEKAVSMSSDKLLTILECIAKGYTPVRLQDLAEKSGMTQSTVQRYLKALLNSNYVYQDEDTLRYGLTWKVCRLTSNMNSYVGLRNIANPFVNNLASTFQMGVCLVVERDNHCVYLDCIDHPQPKYTSLQYIGKHALLHTTGSGKVLLASFSDAQIENYISTIGLPKCTDYTITDSDTLFREIEKVRKAGYALDEQECEFGLKCVSYPIRCYSGSVFAAISMFGNIEDMNEAFVRDSIQPALLKASKTISLRLGWEEL